MCKNGQNVHEWYMQLEMKKMVEMKKNNNNNYPPSKLNGYDAC